MTTLRDYARSIPTATMTPQWRNGHSSQWETKATDILTAARRRLSASSGGAQSGAGGAGAGSGSDWVCSMCTQQNQSYASLCCMCDAPRGATHAPPTPTAPAEEDKALKAGIASCLLTFEDQINPSARVRADARTVWPRYHALPPWHRRLSWLLGPGVS